MVPERKQIQVEGVDEVDLVDLVDTVGTQVSTPSTDRLPNYNNAPVIPR